MGLSANGGLTLTNNNKNQITEAVSSLVENLPTVRGQASQPARLTGNAMGGYRTSLQRDRSKSKYYGCDRRCHQHVASTWPIQHRHLHCRASDAAKPNGRRNGKTINNVVVGSIRQNCLTVIGATTSSKSFIQLLGSQDWGLTDVPVAFGSSSTYAKIDTDTLAGSNLYVTGSGNRTLEGERR